jgi:hypothetical protein
MALTKAHNRMIEGAVTSVTDYGATGDGVTDDTTAIQAALDSGGIIRFPSGTYKITSSLTVPSGSVVLQLNGCTISTSALPAILVSGQTTGFQLVGEGGKIEYTGASTGFLLEVGDGSIINEYWGFVENLTLDGNNVASGLKVNRYRYGRSEAIRYVGCSPIGLYAIETFEHRELQGMYEDQSAGSPICAILIKNASTFSIESCRFSNNTDSIVFEHTGLGASYVDSQSSNVKIYGNNFNTVGVGIELPKQGSLRVGAIVIKDNYFEGDGAAGLTPIQVGVTGTGNAPVYIVIDSNAMGSNDMNDLVVQECDFITITRNYLSGFTTTIASGVTNVKLSQNDYSGLTNNSTDYIDVEQDLTFTGDLKALGSTYFGPLSANLPYSETSGIGTMKVFADNGTSVNNSLMFSSDTSKGIPIAVWNAIDGANTERFHAFYRNGVQIGRIELSGTTAVAYTTTSDYRLKENVVPMTGSIDRIKALRPSNFNFISEPLRTVDGFLAHEAGEIVPEAVSGEKDGEEMQGIDQSKLVPLLVSALQEAITRIEQLETN